VCHATFTTGLRRRVWHVPEALGRAWSSSRDHAHRRLRDVPPNQRERRLCHALSVPWLSALSPQLPAPSVVSCNISNPITSRSPSVPQHPLPPLFVHIREIRGLAFSSLRALPCVPWFTHFDKIVAPIKSNQRFCQLCHATSATAVPQDLPLYLSTLFRLYSCTFERFVVSPSLPSVHFRVFRGSPPPANRYPLTTPPVTTILKKTSRKMSNRGLVVRRMGEA
jgi:hypothetical protein